MEREPRERVVQRSTTRSRASSGTSPSSRRRRRPARGEGRSSLLRLARSLLEERVVAEDGRDIGDQRRRRGAGSRRAARPPSSEPSYARSLFFALHCAWSRRVVRCAAKLAAESGAKSHREDASALPRRTSDTRSHARGRRLLGRAEPRPRRRLAHRMVVRPLAPRRRAPGDDLRGAGSRVGAPPGRADPASSSASAPRSSRSARRGLRAPGRFEGLIDPPDDFLFPSIAQAPLVRAAADEAGIDAALVYTTEGVAASTQLSVPMVGADERPARAEPHDPPALRSAAVGAGPSAHRRAPPREGVPPQGGRPAARAAAPLRLGRDVRRPPRGVGASSRRRRLVRALADRRPGRARLGAAPRGDRALGRSADPDDRPPARDRDDLGAAGLRREHPAGADARARPRRLRGPRRRGLRPSRRRGRTRSTTRRSCVGARSSLPTTSSSPPTCCSCRRR